MLEKLLLQDQSMNHSKEIISDNLRKKLLKNLLIQMNIIIIAENYISLFCFKSNILD